MGRKFGKIIAGVKFMHNTLRIAHLDLKPKNIGENGKVFDYGECAPTSQECGHGNYSVEYTHVRHSQEPEKRTETADIFAMGVTLIEMLCGKINPPHTARKLNGKHACGWELVESSGSWEANWIIGDLKNGKAQQITYETSKLPGTPACDHAKHLVRALLVDFETIQWNDIEELYRAFNDCSDGCCNSRRRLIERFIKVS